MQRTIKIRILRNTMIKGLIFDYGGTLDTAGCHWGQMLWHAYERNNVPVCEQNFRDAYVYGEQTLGNGHIVKSDFTFHKTLDAKIRLEMEWLLMNNKWVTDEDTVRNKHDVVLDYLYSKVVDITNKNAEILKELNEHYKMVLVSNFYGNINEVLKEFHLDGFFSNVIESAVVGIRKPDHRIFSLGVNALGLKPEETVVIGDSFYKDIQPAIKAGCHSVWLKGEGWTEKEYDESIPDSVIYDLKQLNNSISQLTI